MTIAKLIENKQQERSNYTEDLLWSLGDTDYNQMIIERMDYLDGIIEKLKAFNNREFA